MRLDTLIIRTRLFFASEDETFIDKLLHIHCVVFSCQAWVIRACVDAAISTKCGMEDESTYSHETLCFRILTLCMKCALLYETSRVLTQVIQAVSKQYKSRNVEDVACIPADHNAPIPSHDGRGIMKVICLRETSKSLSTPLGTRR